MAEVQLTAEGKKQLEERLEELKVVRRNEVSERIKEARSFGDISENSEYDAAKEEQAMIEGEIFEIEQKLSNATIIESSKSKTYANIGSKITIREVGSNDNEDYTIVGTAEADPMAGRISNESPIGKALIGRKKGDVVDVKVKQSILKFEIVKID